MLLQDLNQTYVKLHTAKEEAFWSKKMGHSAYKEGDFEAKENALKQFVTDAGRLNQVREALKEDGLDEQHRIALKGWLHFFEVNVVESEEAKKLQEKLVAMEGELERARQGMMLGYTEPFHGRFVEAGSDKMRLVLGTSRFEAERKAAWEGLQSIEPFVLANGFLDIVKERNRLGRLLGYEDYYDYKVNLNEGFSKKKLFELLGELERETRSACEKSVQELSSQGLSARDPWNFEFLISGDMTAKIDPYLGFENALSRWGKSFAAMDISYEGATLQLDLLSRKGKEENGFMHGPFPAFVDEGKFRPAHINFTANALPGQLGSGKRALETFFHEGGHAAHFANIKMPAPCYSQEFAPSSVAFAETQSMFMDSLCEDPDWQLRYAKNEKNESMPMELIRENLLREHRFLAYRLRSLLVVPFAEKAIYEMSEAELTPENVLKRLREIEKDILQLTAAVRPVLSVPHLLSGEASAYYHGYVLAQMAVYQTRAYFLEKYGHIFDNPQVGQQLAEKYWRPGNSKTFLQLVEDLTGKPFSAAATVAAVNREPSDVVSDAEKRMAFEPRVPMHTGPVQLDAIIRMVHGDQLVATNEGSTFEAMEATYKKWVSEQQP